MEFIEQENLTCEEDGVQQAAESVEVPQLSLPVEESEKEPEPAETPPETALEAEMPSETVSEADPEEKTVDNGAALSKIEETAVHLSEQVEALTQLFQKRIMYTDHEEKMMDQLHRELQQYKQDLYSRLVQPILLDIIEVRDSIMRIGEVYRSKPEGEQDIPNKTFSDYVYDLQDILEKIMWKFTAAKAETILRRSVSGPSKKLPRRRKRFMERWPSLCAAATAATGELFQRKK